MINHLITRDILFLILNKKSNLNFLIIQIYKKLDQKLRYILIYIGKHRSIINSKKKISYLN